MTNSAANPLPAIFFASEFPLPAVPHDPTNAIDIKHRLTIAVALLQNGKRILPDLRERGLANSPSNPAC
jgi:hypothetical protein